VKKDREDQLDLFGAGEPDDDGSAAPRASSTPRWAKSAVKGRLGWASLEVAAADLAKKHKATIALVVTGDASAWSEVIELDVRHLPLPLRDDPMERQIAALAADARAGRRACVLCDDATLGAFLVGAALVELGADAKTATAALGGRVALGPERFAALLRRATDRGREGEPEEAGGLFA